MFVSVRLLVVLYVGAASVWVGFEVLSMLL